MFALPLAPAIAITQESDPKGERLSVVITTHPLWIFCRSPERSWEASNNATPRFAIKCQDVGFTNGPKHSICATQRMTARWKNVAKVHQL